MASLRGTRLEIGEGAIPLFLEFCRSSGRSRVHIVADENTMAALGNRVSESARAAGIALRSTVFPRAAGALAADGAAVLRLFMDLEAPAAESEPSLLAAVGSGTICDIVRFVAHRARIDFVSLPTAPSVDAYASVVASVLVDGIKVTLPAKAPIAIFADTGVLAAAPRPMIAAGFGDMLCKHSAVADWRLGALLRGEPYDAEIAERALAAARSCAQVAPGIGRADREAVAVLFAGLVESGKCMAEAGSSLPASGAEHHYSHFWETRLLCEGRPPILHGLKVGVGTMITAGLWERVRSTGRPEAGRLLAAASLPDAAAEIRAISRAFGAAAEEAIASQAPFLGFSSLARSIAGSWDAICDIASGVPGPEETRLLLESAGCPTRAEELGLGPEEIELALSSAHYLRGRLTVRKLWKIMDGR
jgi:glycerol-1-phosphate dehydrogenase [NAD(P)+]